MNRVQKQVQEFNRDVLRQPHSPAEPKLRNPELRATLILEEAMETVIGLVGSKKAAKLLVDGAINAKLFSVTHSGFEINEYSGDNRDPDLIETIDGLADLAYVLFGTAEDIGIDLEPFSDEVHRSNMTKRGGEFSAYGKLQKPPWYSPADIAGVLKKVISKQATTDRDE